MIILFTVLALSVLSALIIFQLALILGAPIGKFAWGGQHERLPRRLRIASAVSIVLYLVFMAFIASKAGLVDIVANSTVLNVGMWAFTGYFFVGILMNGISRSTPERNLMTPVAALLAVSFLMVSLA